jgi:hypothetical protein
VLPIRFEQKSRTKAGVLGQEIIAPTRDVVYPSLARRGLGNAEGIVSPLRWFKHGAS